IAQQARKSGGDPIPNLTEASKSFGEKLIDLDGVARLTSPPNPRAGMGKQYEPYKVPEDKIEYPPSDFADEVLKLKEKGEVAVISDQPKANYYVVALMQRMEPSVRDFQRDTSPSFFQYQNALVSQPEQERQREYRLALMDTLRSQAKWSINADARKLVEERS